MHTNFTAQNQIIIRNENNTTYSKCNISSSVKFVPRRTLSTDKVQIIVQWLFSHSVMQLSRKRCTVMMA